MSELSQAVALRAIEELERIHGYKIDVILPNGTHRRYFSTHCRHDNGDGEGHKACSATEISGSGTTRRGVVGKVVHVERPVSIARRPAQCKTCSAPCVCPCHKEVSSG